jgi:hypothetical protein
MQTLDPRSDKEHDRDEPNHTGIGLWTHDIGDDSEGEAAATCSPDGGAADGQIIYARPRDFKDLELWR